MDQEVWKEGRNCFTFVFIQINNTIPVQNSPCLCNTFIYTLLFCCNYCFFKLHLTYLIIIKLFFFF